MGDVIADLVVNLVANNAPLVAATEAAGAALENMAEVTRGVELVLKTVFTETGYQASAMAVKIEESAKASTMAMGAMNRELQAQLSSVRALAAQRDAETRASSQAALAAWHEDVAAIQKLAKQKETALVAADRAATASAREAARDQAAAAREAAREEAMAARERAATSAAMNREIQAQLASSRALAAQRDAETRASAQAAIAAWHEEVAAVQSLAQQKARAIAKAEAEATAAVQLALREQVAEEKAAAAERARLHKQTSQAYSESMGILKTLASTVVGVGESGMKMAGIFSQAGTTIFGAGSMGAAAMGPIGIGAAVAGELASKAFGVVTTVLSAVFDVAQKVALGITVIGTASVIAAAKFEQLMLRTVTMAQAPIAELGHMQQAVLSLSTEVGQTPDMMAKALYHIESLGFRGSQALDMLKRSGQEAALSGANLESVATAMGAMFRAFKEGQHEIKDAADAASYLNAITGIGNMTMQELTSAIGTGILPSLKAAGLGMRDFGAAIALATDNAEPANQSATRLRQTLSMISTAALQPKKIEMFKSIGMEADQMAKDLQKPNGLSTAMHDLKDHLDKTFGKDAIEQLRSYNQILESDGAAAADEWASRQSKAAQVVNQIFGGARSSGMINMLLEQLPQLDANYQRLGDDQERNARFAASWAEQQKQLSQEWNNFKATVENFAIRFGMALIPTVKDVFHEFSLFGKKVKDVFKDSPIPKEFMDNFHKLRSDILPWVKQKLEEVLKVIQENKPGLEQLGHWIATDFGPAAKDVFNMIVGAIKETIRMIGELGNMWKRHHYEVRDILHLIADLFLGTFQAILQTADIAFGWIPGLGPKLHRALTDFEKFTSGVNKTIDDITKIVPIEIHTFVTGSMADIIGSKGGATTDPSNLSILDRMTGTARALGGPVRAGEPYLVGEKGPEIMVPSTSGYIVPNDKLTGATGAYRAASGMSDGAGSRGGGVLLVDAKVYLDGTELRNANIQLQQRYKARNGTSGVT